MPKFSCFRKVFSRKAKPPGLIKHERQVREAKAKKAIEEAAAKRPLEDYFIRSKGGKIPRDHEVLMRGRAFAQKNEQLMAKRQQVLKEFGVVGKKAEKVLRLYRIRKAASELSECRGFITTEAAVALLEFLRENKGTYERFSKSNAAEEFRQGLPRTEPHIIEKIYDGSVGALDHALRAEDPVLAKVLANPANEALFSMAQRADFALDPNGPLEPRFTRGNYFLMTQLPFALSDWMIKEELGDRYSQFSKRIHEERKKI